ncbi:ATP-grasp fold amidoligase family protein [Citricoccus sp. I39-566]|uniref:ATP-grasp fold amidoligase family protein n=1 Tax=Citricoccus sp. I39-566 TaxID=3073268 RepID=UPI00286C6654|nr:ATP-grasp fold amidoligase family protein [Citricoccus sp. I39-566]WMY78060.1 ATP-grasp fold amidoligase family protein [Citricoccus sp. I39-566]
MNPYLKRAASIVVARLPLRLRRELLHFRYFHKPIPRNPVTFLGKIQWRILHDRRSMIAIGGDKLAMKDHAARTSPDVVVPETIWHGQNIDDILDVDWGPEWVLKPREGSGYVAFGSGSLRDSGITIEEVSAWKHMDQFRVQGEWAYGQSAPGYFLERKIPTQDGGSPNDVRFFVFDGIVRLVQTDTPRFDGVRRRFYTPDWTPLDVTQGQAKLAPVAPRPERLDAMLEIAAAIGAGYDFIRVDLYDVPEGIFFGEITPYPTGGMGRYSDDKFDEWLGSFWSLPVDTTD